MSFVAGAIVAAGAATAGASLYGSSRQSKAAERGLDLQSSMWNQARDTQAPFIEAGKPMIPILQQLLTPGSGAGELLKDTPGFQFAQDWGLKGIKNMGTKSGMGGNVLAEAMKFSSGHAANNTFFPMIQALQALVGMSSGAANSLTGNAVNASGAMAKTMMGGANAEASGAMGAANAFSGAAGGLGNLALFKQLVQGGGGMYGDATVPAGQSRA